MKKIFILLFIPLFGMSQNKYNAFTPGKIWNDDRGIHINAHGGGLLYLHGIYYWYGEHKELDSNTANVGINCYSSTDLMNWKFEGVALSVDKSNPTSDITAGCVMERPKVIYNSHTKQFVMWFHLELKGKGYEAARAAVAVSNNPTGPFQYLKSYRPNAGIYPINMTDAQKNKRIQ